MQQLTYSISVHCRWVVPSSPLSATLLRGVVFWAGGNLQGGGFRPRGEIGRRHCNLCVTLTQLITDERMSALDPFAVPRCASIAFTRLMMRRHAIARLGFRDGDTVHVYARGPVPLAADRPGISHG